VDDRAPAMAPPPAAGPRRVLDAGLALFVAVLLGLEALRVFVASVYAMNVLTVGLNASVVAVLFLLAPVAYLVGLARPSTSLTMTGSALVFLAFRVVLLAPWPVEILVVLSGVAVAAFLLFLVPFLASALHLAGGAGMAASSVGLALAADLALRILGKTLDPGATVWSLAYLVPLAGLLLYVLAKVPLLPEAAGAQRARGAALGTGIGLAGFLALAVVVLSYPWFLARWSGQAPDLFAPALLLGFVAGAHIARSGLGPAPRASRTSAVLQTGLLLFAVDLAFFGSEFLAILAPVAAAAAVVGLERTLGWAGAARLDVRQMGLALTVACATFLVLLLAFVFTLTHAYVPGGALWRGRAWAVLLLMGLAALGPSLAAGGRSPGFVPSPVARRGTAVLAASLLILGAAGIALTPPGAPVAPTTDVLRVMTYNVHQGFGADGRLDVGRIADVVRHGNPDLVGLQESDTVRVTSGGVDVVGYLASTLGYHAAYGPPTREQTYGVALLSRLPILSWEYVLLTSQGDQRALLHARVNGTSGAVHVFVVHLGLDLAERGIQVQEVLARVAATAGPRILVGDLNACPSGRCPGETGSPDLVYENVVGALDDAWVEGGGGRDDPAGYTYSSLDPVERIDYVFVSTDLIVLTAQIVQRPAPIEASDHLAVVADVRMVS